jgi:hypothetical protein
MHMMYACMCKLTQIIHTYIHTHTHTHTFVPHIMRGSIDGGKVTTSLRHTT